MLRVAKEMGLDFLELLIMVVKGVFELLRVKAQFSIITELFNLKILIHSVMML